MPEEWITIFGTNALVLTIGPVGVHPGLGRHQLAVPMEVRASNDTALGAEYTFSARLDATGVQPR